MLDQLSSTQIREWETYDRLDPIGEWRSDFRDAQLRSMITNITRALYPEKGVEPKMTTPLDFMPDWGNLDSPEAEEQSVEEQKRILFGIAGDQKRRIRKDQSLTNKKRSKPPPRKG